MPFWGEEMTVDGKSFLGGVQKIMKKQFEDIHIPLDFALNKFFSLQMDSFSAFLSGGFV